MEQETIITFKCTNDFKTKLQAMAAKDNRTVSNYIKTILEKAMTTKEKK